MAAEPSTVVNRPCSTAGRGQHTPFGTQVHRLTATALGQGEQQRAHGQQAQRPDGAKGSTPPHRLADPRGRRHTADVRDGQAREHGCHSACLLVSWHQARRDNRADAKERAMVQARDDARHHQAGVVRGQRRQQVADGEDRHQRGQRLARRPPGQQQGHDRRAQHHPHRVGRHPAAPPMAPTPAGRPRSSGACPSGRTRSCRFRTSRWPGPAGEAPSCGLRQRGLTKWWMWEMRAWRSDGLEPHEARVNTRNLHCEHLHFPEKASNQ